MTRLSLLSSLLLATLALAADAPGFTVHINVTQVPNDKGAVGCLLFASAAGFPNDDGKALMRTFAAIQGGKATCTFEGVPAGRYSVSVMHDENLNQKLDTNFLGMPKEAFGFSNHARPGTFGPPSWDAAAERFDAARDVAIALQAP
jgi:uncharacterized protein (DUF2141 family)